MSDWAQELIAEMHDIADIDDSTKLFCAAYAQGDSVAAWDAYRASAISEVWRGSCVELTFPDGSRCFAQLSAESPAVRRLGRVPRGLRDWQFAEAKTRSGTICT